MLCAQQRVSVDLLWQRYGDRLRGWLLRRVGNPSDADDLLQEVFLRAHQHLDQLRDEQRIAAWLQGIARNVLTDHYRVQGRGQPGELDGEPAVEPEDDTQAQIEAALGRWLAGQVAELPEIYREALELTELGGLSQKEAAQRLGLSHSGFKSRVQRGRALLRERLAACCRVELDRRGGVLDVERRQQPGEDC